MTAATILLALSCILLLASILISFLSCANILQDTRDGTSPRMLLRRFVTVFAVTALSLVFTCTALLALQGGAHPVPVQGQENATVSNAKPIENLQVPAKESIVKIESLMRSQSLPEE